MQLIQVVVNDLISLPLLLLYIQSPSICSFVFSCFLNSQSHGSMSTENIGNSDDTMRGTDLNHPITILEESTSPVVEPEAVSSSEFTEPEVVSSSESDDDNEYVYNRIRRSMHGKIWSVQVTFYICEILVNLLIHSLWLV